MLTNRRRSNPSFVGSTGGGGGRKDRLQLPLSQVFSILILMCFYVSTSSGISPPKTNQLSLDCHDLGFTDSLLCSSCKDLEGFVGDANSAVIEECKKCCSLEATQQKLGAFPSVKDFIDNKSKNFNKVSVNYVSGASPVIELTDTEGKVEKIKKRIVEYCRRCTFHLESVFSWSAISPSPLVSMLYCLFVVYSDQT
ncbi:15 kDa selenoprotein [Heterostelium album PN500]|uniref:Selenoprotein F n=1 Tax=Heterostelium pallidum (strain ATCC 26659 / Pp 5 / PN500) TaxID=670386 RepID=D3BI98_HETP5|nr:15 kDa selenoprotein [Heterostelium album PN500]EFA78998.1 15 kDa selenoprotein [Heterostelium album PN500]|eukprot:XP_020431122.1 15 kDa selenoprotein [Heterostelium album PN500]